MKTVIELMYRKGDKKFRYDTKKQRQVQMVIQDLKEMKIGAAADHSVFEQIVRGERIVSGTPKKTVSSAMEEPKAEHFQISPGIVPPEEQFQEFLTNERYERRQIHPAVTGGSFSFLSDYAQAYLEWVEMWRGLGKKWITLWFKFWFPFVDFPKDVLGSFPPH
jgi:hypothetical protein